MAEPGGAKVRTVADVMSDPPVTATPSETIAEATGRMRDHRVGSVVVVIWHVVAVRIALEKIYADFRLNPSRPT